MKIIKFEGEIFENTSGYEKAVEIIKNKYNDLGLAIVIPCDSKTEALLTSLASIAVEGNNAYAEQLKELEEQMLNNVRSLVPIQAQSGVLSFIKKCFNELEKLYTVIEILGECPANALESILCYGSTISSQLFTAVAKGKGLKMKWMDSGELFMVLEEEHDKNIDLTFPFPKDAIEKEESMIHVFAGGISKGEKAKHVHFKRGGADKTAAALSVLLESTSIDYWTGSSGIMTANPILVKNARPISHLNYEEAMELTHFDSSLLHPPSLTAMMKRGIPIQIRSINSPTDNGTMISNELNPGQDFIKGISSLNNICLLNIEGSGMIGIPGFSRKIFSNLNDAGINIILITQGASEHSICVGVNNEHATNAKHTLDEVFKKEIESGTLKPILLENELSIIALVGDQMKSHPGISGKMFSTLGKNGVNIRAIAQGSNERNISAVIKSTELEKALNALHEGFFGNTKKEINLFLIGTGKVGKKLITQLIQQSGKIEQAQHLKINLTGICNSRKMLLSKQNMLSENWQELLEAGEKSNIQDFTKSMVEMNLRNSVLVDITANEIIPEIYPIALEKSISVVACNKIAASSKFEKYKALKDLAVAYNAKFLFETNVGAALPIISTINDIIKSGDKIIRIDAVLSGTLNYVFNNYTGNTSFASIVKKAQEEGYTEPDPRLDLSGIDVMRKIMILARESGEQMNIDEVSCNSFLPASCMNGTVDEFYTELEKNESHFKKILDDANSENAKLKFVASLENGKASAGLQHIKEGNEMFHLYGKDNIVLIRTERYNEQPLVIKGAGAGAEVTASGVFADILRTIQN